MQKAVDEARLLFNGADGAARSKKLTGQSGEKVRMFFRCRWAQHLVSFHVIGAIFDRVYGDGGSRYQENVQTTLVPPGARPLSSSCRKCRAT